MEVWFVLPLVAPLIEKANTGNVVNRKLSSYVFERELKFAFSCDILLKFICFLIHLVVQLLKVAAMAFFSKAGNVLKQTVNKRINSEIFGSNPSIFQMIRCMSSSKLFVGGIAYSADDTSLREAFNKYGEVVEARVIVDRETGRSRGFGFVTYTSGEEASAAIQALDGQVLITCGTGTDSGSSGNYSSQSLGVAGGGGGSDNYVSGVGSDGGVNSNFGSSGFEGRDQFGSNESNNMADASEDLDEDDPIEGNYGNDDEPDDYANKRA
ncbi:hypothetical protein TEA_027958 [Camellia sinensis var. sinensis]|uniref:RRM domain-containing protein n=1 Tax=Camellia sinensis var. sinensis TaxID=542762 RepID=A0A4S4F1Q6_CAMSN|nr:hypothetical protein TEA_027958 [Camellia sinensis var. sinensis]